MSAWLSAFADARALAKEGETAFADFNPIHSSVGANGSIDQQPVDNDDNGDSGAFKQPKELSDFVRGVAKTSGGGACSGSSELVYKVPVAVETVDRSGTIDAVVKSRARKGVRKMKRGKLYKILGKK